MTVLSHRLYLRIKERPVCTTQEEDGIMVKCTGRGVFGASGHKLVIGVKCGRLQLGKVRTA